MIYPKHSIGSYFDSINTGDYVENNPAVPVRVWRKLTKINDYLLGVSDIYTTIRPNAKIWTNEDLLNINNAYKRANSK